MNLKFLPPSVFSLTVPSRFHKLRTMGIGARPALLAIAVLGLVAPHTFTVTAPSVLSDPPNRQAVTGTRGGNLVVAVSSDPSTFNRMLTSGVANAMIADRLSGDLVHINRVTMELEPALAWKWEADKEGRQFTLHLQKGLRFSDGSPFSADDVLFTFQVLQDPKSGAVQAGNLRVDGSFPEVAKADDYTVRLSFNRPVGMGLRMLDSIPILPRHLLEKHYANGTFTSAWGPTAAPGEVAGMGPFRLREYQRGSRVVLERNPHYWKKDRNGQALPYLDTITYLIIPDRNTEALRFQAGEIDLVSSLNPENYAGLRRAAARQNLTLRDLGPGLMMDFLWFNLNPGAGANGKPFVDPEKRAVLEKAEFRQAVSHALDRQGMSRSIYLGLGTPQFGPISSGNKAWHHTGIPATAFNAARARALLRGIGLVDADGDGILEFGLHRRPLELTLLTSRGNMAREKTAQVLRENLAAVGLRVDIQLLLPNEVAARFLNSFDYEAILFGITPTDIVPDLQTDLWLTSGKLHFWHPGQSAPHTAWEREMDRLTARLVTSLDPAVRKSAFFKMQEIWARELPAISIIAPNIIVGWKNTLGNLRPSILVPYLLWNAEEITKRSP